MQKSTTKFLNTSIITINKMTNQDLQLKKAEKLNVTDFCQAMWFNAMHFVEPYMKTTAGDKWKYIVTLDEA